MGHCYNCILFNTFVGFQAKIGDTSLVAEMMKLRKTRETALKTLAAIGKKKRANEEDGDITIIEPDGGMLLACFFFYHVIIEYPARFCNSLLSVNRFSVI